MSDEKTFSKDQLKQLENYASEFKQYAKSKEYTEDAKAREQHEAELRSLTRESLLALEAYDFNEVISRLWAMEMWGSKAYPLGRIHQENDFTELKRQLSNLLFGADDIAKRYDEFKQQTKHIGTAIASELLCLVDPHSYAIWNTKAREGLRVLGFDEELPLNRPQTTGAQYKAFLNVALQINSFLKTNGLPDSDLLLVDHYLYHVASSASSTAIEQETPEGLEHDELMRLIAEIGEWLGFESRTKEKIAKGSEVDVTWHWRVGNIGEVRYIFEVQKKGSIKSALFNLMKATSNPAVQKLVVVSDRKQIEEFREKAEGLPIASALAFWEEADVVRIHRNLEETYDILRRLDLMKPRAPT